MNGNDGIDNLKTLPPEDDRIDQALQELDAKLDAWAQVILDTQANLKALSSSVSTGEAGEATSTDNAQSIATDVTETENEIETQPLAGITGLGGVTQDVAETTELNDVTPEKAEPEATEEPQPIESSSPVTMESAPAEPVESNSMKEEDEALLATLDPDMLKKIQVLRRLTSKKRSVRELIEQVKASASGAPAPIEHKKKSFWRR